MYKLWRKNYHDNSKSAPEPSGAWPLIGHLHLLGGQVPLYRIFGGLADEYGPVFGLRLGMNKTQVVSSWETVKDCFTTNDKILAKRPTSIAGTYLGYDYASFGFTDSPYWREVRKLALQELLSSRRLETLKHVRESEIHTGIKELYKEHSGKVVDIDEWLDQITSNMIIMMIAGKRYTNGTQGTESTMEVQSIRKHIKEFMYVLGQFIVADAFPFPPFSWIDYQGHIKSMKRITKGLSTIFERWINEHVTRGRQSSLRNEQDFIDVMLSTVDDRASSSQQRHHFTPHDMALMLTAKQQTSHAMSPRRAKHAIIKEALRLYPPGPLAAPHEATEDCCVGGYHTPKGTRVMFNLWKLHRDPRMWEEPDNFVPERFLTSHAEVDFTGQNYEFIPFGSGRRSCPGITFAMQVAHLTLARLLQGFDLITQSNVPVDMTEGLRVNLPKATPLKVVITPRVSSGLYQN
ncbi:UNVERIFIED_CONTAM: Xanthotoxin 5-hydroxylase CYP82C2 [Sesamum latifolium]|uniref:Xanthotoxin 5-hydroxylase CYP82C2 n=1 Tax=Sesamum latifolium TaxID=2727402 RepID=A0AAW2Y3W9_9LAMI